MSDGRYLGRIRPRERLPTEVFRTKIAELTADDGTREARDVEVYSVAEDLIYPENSEDQTIRLTAKEVG